MTVYDQISDPQHQLLYQIVQERPELVGMFKTASIPESGSLPPTAYADPSFQQFPIHTPEHAVLSKLYVEKQASVHESVRRNIDTALALYGLDPADLETSQTKVAATTMPDNVQFLLPQYSRLAVRSKADIQPVAGTLLAQRHRLKVASLAGASVRLVKIAAAEGLAVKDLPLDVYKYAGMTNCDAGILLDWVDARAVACSSLEHRGLFDKIAEVVKANFPRNGVIDDRRELVKIAQELEKADERAGLTHLYGRTLEDPLRSVFNMEKVADCQVDLGGRTFSVEALIALPPGTLEEVIGEDILTAAAGADGIPDPEQLKAILETLPADLKTLIATTLGPHMSQG